MSSKELLTGVHLDKSQVLGEGAFGVVYRGRLGDAGVAIKTIKANSPEQAAELEATLLEEAAVWAAVQHPNVVQFYGVHKDAEGGLYLVSELMDGSVEGLLHEDGERVADGEEAQLTARQQLTMCLHVACALQRLHQLKILHSDLAARNVLYKRTGGGELVFKVTDFGLATVGKGSDGASASASRSYQLVSREQVPVRWCAPEVLKRQLYSPEADVWSLGVYMWEVFSLGELPYGLHMTNAQIYQQITPAKSTFRLEKPEDCKREVFEVMTSCWQFGRKLRATLPEIEGKLRLMRDKSKPSAATATATAKVSPSMPQWRLEENSSSPMGSRTNSPSSSRLSSAGGSSDNLQLGEESFNKGEEASAKGNNSVALEFYRQGADYGHAGAQAALGRFYLNGRYVKKNETLALDYFRKAAVQGNGEGMVAMGDAYRFGIGDVVQSPETAYEWYKKAGEIDFAPGVRRMSEFASRGLGRPASGRDAFRLAERGSQLKGGEDCLVLLGCYYTEGEGCERNPEKGAALAMEAMRAGSASGESFYAYMLLLGKWGVEKDEKKALEILERLAAADVPRAVRLLGFAHACGFGLPVNMSKGGQLMKRAMELDDLTSIAVYGYWLAVGIGMEKKENEGIRILKKAAAQNSADAQLYLGNVAESRKETKNALAWWRLAKDKNGEACFRLSSHLVLNAPVDSDISEGVALMKQSVEMGHPDGTVILGGLYCTGVGVKQDLRTGAEWLQRGAKLEVKGCVKDLGIYLTRDTVKDKELIQLGLTSLGASVKEKHTASCLRLGELYAKGQFVKQDKALARRYLSIAANDGELNAQMLLAEISDELGDPRQAVKWYEKAARQKNLDAAFRLAEHVENGNGATVNLHTAMAWYTRVDTAESLYRQGLILLQGGDGVTADLGRAAAAFKRASEKGHRDATYRLGLHARDGVGMAIDKKEAVRLFTKAADEGSAEASWALGHCYEAGYGGLKKDKKAATYYFEAAAAAGHQEAKDHLKGGKKKSGIRRLM